MQGPVAIAHLGLRSLEGMVSGTRSPASSLAGKRVVAASGIADPDAFVAQMKATGAAVQVATWKDHHDYRDEDVAWLAHAARRADHVVITQKDAVKLRDRWPTSVPEPLVAVLDLEWEEGGERIAAALDAVVTPVEWTVNQLLGANRNLYDHRHPPSEPRRHSSRQGHVSRRGESLRGDDVALRLRGHSGSASIPGCTRCSASPEKQIIVSVPILRDNGEVEVYSGYRVLYNTSRGPAKGGIRFDTERHAGRGEGAGRLDDVEVRGGQHSVRRRQGRRGLRSRPRMSNAELERLTRRYTSAIIETLGPDSDVPAPDVNTNERVMAWIMDTYSMHKRHTVTAVVTGKPVEMGGSLGRREATGRGCMLVTREALNRLRMPVAGHPGGGAGLRQRRLGRRRS